MEGRGREKSGKGSRENKTCKSKNMTGAARVCDCGGHSRSTVLAAPQSGPCGDTVGLHPPCHVHARAHPPAMELGSGHVLSGQLRARRPAEHGQPHAGPAAAFRSGLGQQCRSLHGERQPGQGDAADRSPASAMFRGRHRSLQGDCEEASYDAPRGHGLFSYATAGEHPAAKPSPR